jgi:carbon-monoxide dehydrogenase large subunit
LWVRYAVVDDWGTVINPMLVEGQLHGGVAQGLGGALLERFAYNEDGQLLTKTTFIDYLLPSFHDVPDYEVHHLNTHSLHPEGGFKGMGESRAIPPAPWRPTP